MFFMFAVCMAVFSSVYSQTDVCKKWFAENGIKTGTNCVLECMSSPTGMGTFICTRECKDLCNKIDNSNSLYFYYGLTDQEKKLVSLYKTESITVFVQKEKAEAMSISIFGSNRNGDESDAVRHFAWAAFLYKELGMDKAKMFLDAHEDTDRQLQADKAMDLANNRAGLIVADRLVREKRFSYDEVKKEALKALKDRTLIVNSSSGDKK